MADFSAQAVVNSVLMKAFPSDPIVGEEDAKDLRVPEGAALKEKVVQLTNSVLQQEDAQLTEAQVLDAIDYGVYAGGPTGRHWALDPIDGTLGFLRGEQFAVCLALIVDGVIKVPCRACVCVCVWELTWNNS